MCNMCDAAVVADLTMLMGCEVRLPLFADGIHGVLV